MSYQATTWAAKVRTGSHVLKAVLMAVANYADEEGECYPSQARLAFDTELTDRTVREALSRLEEMGIINRTRRSNEDGYRSSDRIRLNGSYRKEPPLGPSDLPEGGSGRASKSYRKDVPVGLPEDHNTPTGISLHKNGSEVPGNSKEKLEGNSTPISPDGDREPEEEAYPLDFEALWAEVPKPSEDPLANPGSKAKAYQAWRKLKLKTREACFFGWQSYLEVMEERRKKRPDYPIKQLVAWINGKEWETYQKDAA